MKDDIRRKFLNPHQLIQKKDNPRKMKFFLMLRIDAFLNFVMTQAVPLRCLSQEKKNNLNQFQHMLRLMPIIKEPGTGT